MSKILSQQQAIAVRRALNAAKGAAQSLGAGVSLLVAFKSDAGRISVSLHECGSFSVVGDGQGEGWESIEHFSVAYGLDVLYGVCDIQGRPLCQIMAPSAEVAIDRAQDAGAFAAARAFRVSADRGF